MKLDYGKNGIELEIDPNWNTKIIQPTEQFPIENPIKAIRDAIKNPVGNNSRAGSIVSPGRLSASKCVSVLFPFQLVSSGRFWQSDLPSEVL